MGDAESAKAAAEHVGTRERGDHVPSRDVPEGRAWMGAEEMEDGADGVEVHPAADGLLGASGVGDAYSGEE